MRITSVRHEIPKEISVLDKKPKPMTLSQLLWICALCVLASALVFIDIAKWV